MKLLRIAFLLFLYPLLTASTEHKFYVSITKIEYVAEKQSLQIITKIFIEDVETVLKERYDSSISLDTKNETEVGETYLTKYILQKLKINVNGVPVNLKYLGKEYDTDIVKSYFEIDDVSNLKTLEVENKVLMDMYAEQQNIIHIKTASNRTSLVLDKEHPKDVLNLN